MRAVTRSLRNRLALLFGLIVLGAILVVYLFVIPPLEGQLRTQKVEALAETARVHVPPLRSTVDSDIRASAVRARVRTASARTGARVTLLDVASGTEGPGLTVSVDSQASEAAGDDARFPVADLAVRSGRQAGGTEPTSRGRIAEVAIPLFAARKVAKIAVFSDDLEAV